MEALPSHSHHRRHLQYRPIFHERTFFSRFFRHRRRPGRFYLGAPKKAPLGKDTFAKGDVSFSYCFFVIADVRSRTYLPSPFRLFSIPLR